MTAVQLVSTPVPLGADRGLPFTVRTAVVEDLPFIDMLQKRYSKEVGFLPTVALKEHIEAGRIAIGFENDEPAAYILAKANYGRDSAVGIMYQAAVEYDAQRRLLGTALLEHAISLLPPTVKLVSAWVAQDIEANFFWEHCGFEPIAARKGSEGRGRVHIYWQRRRNPQDARTALRFPKQTHGGVMRARRKVVGIGRGQAWNGIQRDQLPDAPKTINPAQAARQFRYGQSPWILVIINGVSRYLPTPAEIDVPDFMNTAPAPMVAVGAKSGPVVPRSQIPGL